jgi:uncharacterized protein GlcG (DUF336 family)
MIKTAVARLMMDAARAKAAEIGAAVSIAIVDLSGCLVLLERFDSAGAYTAVIAEGKAASSALTGRDSGQLTGMATNPVLMSTIGARLGNRMIAARGAIVLRDQGAVVGAIGASGASGEEDEQIAEAGAVVFHGMTSK